MKQKIKHRVLRNQLLDKREKLGVTQRDVAAMLGIKQNTYHGYENGTSAPKGERKKIIEDYLAS